MNWTMLGRTPAYVYWYRQEGDGIIYNVTKGEEPSPTAGGYSDLVALQKLKGDFTGTYPVEIVSPAALS